MGPARTSTYGRWAIWLMLMALLLLVFATAWLFLMQQPPLIEHSPETRQFEARRLSALLMILMVSILLILVFVIGAYLLIRIGRAVAATGDRAKPTEYVDAWSQYRLSEDDIAQATEEPLGEPGKPDEDEPDNDSPGEDPPRR